jgi:hypothetical protein
MSMCVLRRVAALLILIAGLAAARADGDDGALYVSDPAAAGLLSSTQGWGELGRDTAVRPPGRAGAPLQIGDRAYDRGLGHHAPGQITLDLAGQFAAFDAEVGLQRQEGQAAGSVVFRILADGVPVFDSGVMRQSDPARPVSIPTRGVEELSLIVTDAGDGITCDCADWALARLTPDPDAPRPADRPSVDVAPFARLMSWDPSQVEGTKAGRTQPFPPADIEPGRELQPDSSGWIAVPNQNGRAGVGLQWHEPRSLSRVELELADAATIPDDDEVALETWVGESPWQGRWSAVATKPTREGRRLTWTVDGPPTPKLRWVLPSGGQTVHITRLAAFTRSRWKPVTLRIEPIAPRDETAIPIDLFNGLLIDPGPDESPTRFTWNPTQPRDVRLLASLPRIDKTDRTTLRFGTFAIAVEDVRAYGSVPFGGVRVSCLDPSAPIAIPGPAVTPGVLDNVRQQPEESVEHTMAVVHRDIQDLGPMLVSLACDNRKVLVEREGAVVFDSSNGIDDPPRELPDQWRLNIQPGIGDAGTRTLTRRLRGGWLPMPETTTREGGVAYRQTTSVAPIGEARDGRPAWVRDEALAVVELSATNDGPDPSPARLVLALAQGGSNQATLTLQPTAWGSLVAAADGRLVAVLDTRDASPLEGRIEPGRLVLEGTLPPGRTARSLVRIPLWRVDAADATGQGGPVLADPAETLASRTHDYWNQILRHGSSIQVPDPFLSDVIRASIVHCYLAARSEAGGTRVAAWISSDRYGPLESEAHAVIRGMDLMGQTEFARRALEFFRHRYSPEGFLTTGYTLVGTGEHLWTLAEHLDRSPDPAWLDTIAPDIERVAGWIVQERAKTPSGLMPPGVSADWNRYAYRFFNDAQFSAGLSAAARLLAQAHRPVAQAIQQDADRYQADGLRAYRWTQSRSPVLPLGNGRWALAQPSLLESFGHVEEFLPGEDANRSWAYSVELGAHHLAAVGVLDPASDEVADMLAYLEGSAFLRSGMGEYPEEASRNDPYGLGGFAKVQPFYARVAELYAARGEVKPFLRAYFHAMASLVSRENLSFWEHFHNQAGWNKTHETGWFLAQTRLMLVQERGNDLWLAPLIPRAWLAMGQDVSAQSVPTRFGLAGFVLSPSADARVIEAIVHPPVGLATQLPDRIVLRVPHPEDRPIRRVLVAGHPHTHFDPQAQTITLPPTIATPTAVRVEFD